MLLWKTIGFFKWNGPFSGDNGDIFVHFFGGGGIHIPSLGGGFGYFYFHTDPGANDSHFDYVFRWVVQPPIRHASHDLR